MSLTQQFARLLHLDYDRNRVEFDRVQSTLESYKPSDSEIEKWVNSIILADQFQVFKWIIKSLKWPVENNTGIMIVRHRYQMMAFAIENGAMFINLNRAIYLKKQYESVQDKGIPSGNFISLINNIIRLERLKKIRSMANELC